MYKNEFINYSPQTRLSPGKLCLPATCQTGRLAAGKSADRDADPSVAGQGYKGTIARLHEGTIERDVKF